MNPRNRRSGGGLSERVIKSVPRTALAPLSRRQADVLGWIAAGKRNGEIATILTISGRTVEKHVEKIFEALNVETRSAAASWWHEQRLKMERARARKGAVDLRRLAPSAG